MGKGRALGAAIALVAVGLLVMPSAAAAPADPHPVLTVECPTVSGFFTIEPVFTGGDLLKKLSVTNPCEQYVLLSIGPDVDNERRLVVAPGASVVLSPSILRELGWFQIPGPGVGVEIVTDATSSPCAYSVKNPEYLIQTNGAIVPFPSC